MTAPLPPHRAIDPAILREISDENRERRMAIIASIKSAIAKSEVKK